MATAASVAVDWAETVSIRPEDNADGLSCMKTKWADPPKQKVTDVDAQHLSSNPLPAAAIPSRKDKRNIASIVDEMVETQQTDEDNGTAAAAATTTPCKFFAQGRCKFESGCKFAHVKAADAPASASTESDDGYTLVGQKSLSPTEILYKKAMKMPAQGRTIALELLKICGTVSLRTKNQVVANPAFAPGIAVKKFVCWQREARFLPSVAGHLGLLDVVSYSNGLRDMLPDDCKEIGTSVVKEIVSLVKSNRAAHYASRK